MEIRRSLCASLIFHAAAGFPEMPIAEDLFFVRLVSKQGRIAIAPAHAVTSGRRWKEVGLLRTTLINQLILAGFALGDLSQDPCAPLPLVPHLGHIVVVNGFKLELVGCFLLRKHFEDFHQVGFLRL